MLLADMGADVIRVDRRQGSEDRYTGPVTEGGEGGAFLSLNRNKRSLTLDSSQPAPRRNYSPAGCKSADVVVANLPIACYEEDGHWITIRCAAINPGYHPGAHFRFRSGWALRESPGIRYDRAGHVRRDEL